MLNVEKTALTQQSQHNSALMIAQEKKMALCETCGSFLVANDAAERTQSHVTGKQHVGYGMVRDFLSEYKVFLTRFSFSLFLTKPHIVQLICFLPFVAKDILCNGL